MAEGRMLKKNISQSKKLALLKNDSARLLYTWILPHLDIEKDGQYLNFKRPDPIKKLEERVLALEKAVFTDTNPPSEDETGEVAPEDLPF